jgi:hypothetical protein
LHDQHAVAVIDADEVAGPEEQPSDPPIDAHGKAVCPCSKGGFRGRHYVNNDDGWRQHCATEAHKAWRAREIASTGVQTTQPMLACDMEWMKREDTASLQAICKELGINAATGKKFIAFQLKDVDLPAIRHFTFERMLSTFGLARGQVLLIRQHIDALSQPEFPSAMQAMLPRASAVSDILHPLPRPYVPVVVPQFALSPHVLDSTSSASVQPLPPPVTQALFPAVPATQPRAAGGRFGKKGRGGEE